MRYKSRTSSLCGSLMESTSISGTIGGNAISAAEEPIEQESPRGVQEKSTSFFKEVNPETDCRSAIARKLPYAGGDANFCVSQHTSQEVIDREIAKSMIVKKAPKRPATLCFPIMRLANPKGVCPKCEMCSGPATLCCSSCGTTFYCTWAHRYLDSLHHVLCDQLKVIRGQTIVSFNTQQRKRIEAQKLLVKERLLEDLVRQAYVKLYTGNFMYTVGALTQSLNYVSTVFGPGNDDVHKITIFVGIIEAEIGLSRLASAEKSMNNALMQLWRAEDTNTGGWKLNYARALVNKAQGLLKYVKEEYYDAIYYFSDFIYHISEASSPTGPRACAGYLLLAKSFLGAKQTENGYLILDFCVQLWQNYLKNIFNEITRVQKQTMFDFDSKQGEVKHLLIFFRLEVTQQLEAVLAIVNEKSHPEIVCRTILCKGLLMYIQKSYREAKSCACYVAKFPKILANNHDMLYLCKSLEKQCLKKEVRQSYIDYYAPSFSQDTVTGDS